MADHIEHQAADARSGGETRVVDQYTAFAGVRIDDDRPFDDLRGTGVTMRAEAGCMTAEIAIITGPSQAHAQKILDGARTLARSAIVKLKN